MKNVVLQNKLYEQIGNTCRSQDVRVDGVNLIDSFTFRNAMSLELLYVRFSWMSTFATTILLRHQLLQYSKELKD